MSEETKIKDPVSTLDYQFDWTPWLEDGEIITAFNLTVTTGITLGTGALAPVQANGKITYWLSGGTAGSSYTVQCTIETNIAGRIDNRKMIIKVRDR